MNNQLARSIENLNFRMDSLMNQNKLERFDWKNDRSMIKALQLEVDSLKSILNAPPGKKKVNSYALKKEKFRPHFMEELSFNKQYFTVFVINDLKRTDLNFFHTNERNQLIGTFAGLQKYTARKSKKLVFATNGGIFTPAFQPEGLYIENGKELYPLNLNNGRGNFFLKPNGVFYINKKGRADIVESAAFQTKVKSKSSIKLAIQSGPLLVNNGKIHPAFRPGSSNTYIRNGVGVDAGGRLIFVLSKQAINLYDFAKFFKNRLKCNNALYLDGAISKMFISQQHKMTPTGTFAVLIGVTEAY